MSALRALAEIKEKRILWKAAGLGAGSLLGTQAAVVASLAGIDWWKQRGRKQRDAPRPGTYTAQVQDSALTVYTSGEDVYEDMLEAIDNAQHSIHMETFIWKADDLGQRFLDAMNAASERGVDVFVIFDGFANLVVPRTFYQFDAKIHVFRMPFLRRPFWKGPLRFSGLNHSKILVVDDNIGFVGGFNIGSLYSRQWRDTHVREIGPAVWGLRNAIATVWNEDREPGTAIEWIPPKSWDPEVRVNANLPIQIVYPIREMYMNAIDRAQHHIWINTPYFIPDQQVLDTLLDAARRGVDVRIMVPKDSNHILADWVSRGFYGQLLDGGVTILLYAACMIHAKTTTIDGAWSTVGTANLDRLSLSFNYETNVEIVDRDFAAEMEKVFLSDSEHCEELTSPRWRDRHPMARVAEIVLVPLRPLL